MPNPQDNPEEILRRRLVTGIKDDGSNVDNELDDVERMLLKQYKIKMLKSLVAEPATTTVVNQPPPQQAPAPVAEQPFKLTGNFDISAIVAAETAARSAAEAAKDQATRAYFEAIADKYRSAMEMMISEMKNMRATPLSSHDPIEYYKSIKGFLDELKKDITPQGHIASGTDPTVLIELKRMELEHSEKLIQMQEETRDRDRHFQLDLAKMAKHDMAINRLSQLGDAIAGGISEAMGSEHGAGVSSKPRIAGFRCEFKNSEGVACGANVPVLAGQGKATCPKCGSEYEVTEK